MRDGEEPRLASENWFGNLLLIGEGDTIPADALLIAAVELKTLESSLTGESVPVRKAPRRFPGLPRWAIGKLLFAETTVVYGHGRALVTGTRMNTELVRTGSKPPPGQLGVPSANYEYIGL